MHPLFGLNLVFIILPCLTLADSNLLYLLTNSLMSYLAKKNSSYFWIYFSISIAALEMLLCKVSLHFVLHFCVIHWENFTQLICNLLLRPFVCPQCFFSKFVGSLFPMAGIVNFQKLNFFIYWLFSYHVTFLRVLNSFARHRKLIICRSLFYYYSSIMFNLKVISGNVTKR